MPRQFDPNTNARIPAPTGPPAPQKGQPRSSPAARGAPGVRVRSDEVQKPIPAPGQAPSDQRGFRASEGAVFSAEGPVETKREFLDPQTGEKLTQEAPAEGGGLGAPEEPEQAQLTEMMSQGTSMTPKEAVEEPPPDKLSPLGKDSPLEQFMGGEGGKGVRLGAKHHMREIAVPDGSNMSPEERKSHEKLTIRTFQRFGKYQGDDDPSSPAPPIRPGKYNFNPTTGQRIPPEGAIDLVGQKMKQIREGKRAERGPEKREGRARRDERRAAKIAARDARNKPPETQKQAEERTKGKGSLKRAPRRQARRDEELVP